MKKGNLALLLILFFHNGIHFLFFEVSPVSFHQVSEIISKKSRISISGWFHGKPFERPPPLKDSLPNFIVPLEEKDEKKQIDLDEWISREYRKIGTMGKIRKKFELESSIELHNFLKPDKYNALYEALTVQQWNLIGPPNKRHHSVPSSTIQPILIDFKNVLYSNEFAEFIGSITNLTPEKVFVEIRKFSHRDYTLGHDLDPEIEQSGLDLTFCILPPRSKWTTTMGGSSHYLVSEQDEELVTIFPRENALSLVYRTGGGIVRFVKYLTHNVPGPRYDFNMTYRVQEDDGENNK